MMLQTGKRIQNRGFLLIELMVSVSILSIGIVLILNSFTKPLKLAGLSQDYFKAGLLVEEKMYELSNTQLQNGDSEGLCDDFDKRFSWKLDVEDVEDGFMKGVNLMVLWKKDNKEEDFGVVTYL